MCIVVLMFVVFKLGIFVLVILCILLCLMVVILLWFGLLELDLILVVFLSNIVVGGVFVINVNEWFL